MDCKFGYLPKKCDLEFEYGKISTLENPEKLISNIKTICHESNGFFHVQTHQSEKKSTTNPYEPVIKSPPFSPNLFNFYQTHSISLPDVNDHVFDLKSNYSFFTLQVIGYITGYRVMPNASWFDLKIPSRPTINTYVGDKYFINSLNISINNWLLSSEEKKVSLSNLLYIFNRNPCYLWDFERFTFDYQIIDTCFKLLKPSLNLKKNVRHHERLNIILNHFEISFDQSDVDNIVVLRNDLVHELKWGKELFAGETDENRFRLTYYLHRLNHRILGRMMGLTGKYFKTNPNSIGTYIFDVSG